ncbi:pyridoxal-phosphate dependent enzyme [candidate division KSB1 bacterium]
MNLYIQTPCFESTPLSNRINKPVLLKMECFQPAGSFKIRGIGLLCKEFKENGVDHFISSSGGNAGYSVAYAGKRLEAKVTVIVPETTPKDVCERINQEGAEVIVQGEVWDESHKYALKLANDLGAAYIHPFDHPTIWKGHSTIVDEMVQQCQRPPDAIILSVGGGGLLCGVVEGLQRNNWNEVQIIAVETDGTDSLSSSVKTGRLVTLDRIDSIATTLAAKQVAAQAFEYSQSYPITTYTVSDQEAVNACKMFSYDHRVLVEPACGASLSVVYNNSELINSLKTVIVIVCGGIGVSLEKLEEWSKT